MQHSVVKNPNNFDTLLFHVLDKSNIWPRCVLVRKMLKDHCKTMDTDTRTEIHINIVGGNEMSFHLFWPGAQ